jgi:hypothetical protein
MWRLDPTCTWHPQWLELDLVMQEYTSAMACLTQSQAMSSRFSLQDTGKVSVFIKQP